MTSKLLQFQNGLKGLKKRNLNTKSKKKEKEKAKKVKHLTHINLKGITKGTPESDIHTYKTEQIKSFMSKSTNHNIIISLNLLK